MRVRGAVLGVLPGDVDAEGAWISGTKLRPHGLMIGKRESREKRLV